MLQGRNLCVLFDTVSMVPYSNVGIAHPRLCCTQWLSSISLPSQSEKEQCRVRAVTLARVGSLNFQGVLPSSRYKGCWFGGLRAVGGLPGFASGAEERGRGLRTHHVGVATANPHMYVYAHINLYIYIYR